MPSEILNKARAYEAKHGAAISPAERPAYHMTPYVGWLNDPNGFSYYKGKYHQFYQYNPYDVRWAPMHWGQDNLHILRCLMEVHNTDYPRKVLIYMPFVSETA